MASSSRLSFFYFSTLFLLFPLSANAQRVPYVDDNVTEADLLLMNINNALFERGYLSCSFYLDRFSQDVPPLLDLIASAFNNNTNTSSYPHPVTVFCPPNGAFNEFPHTTPHYGLLLPYHIAPIKIEKEDLESDSLLSLGRGSMIDTLVPRHPLVVTSTPGKPSINHVRINDWDIYNDGHLIFHGIEKFFDPTFPFLFQHDAQAPNNNDNNQQQGASSTNNGLANNLIVYNYMSLIAAAIVFLF